MHEASTTLRAGEPAFATEAASLIYESSHELMDFLFGERSVAEHVVGKLYRRAVGHFSHRFSTAALLDGRVVGLELGYDRGQLAKQTAIGGVLLLVGSPLSRWWHLIATSGRVIDAYVPRPGEHAYYINNIAVSSRLRGHGIGERLLFDALERARRHRYRAVELDVTAVNDRAIRFYRKHGFTAVSQSGSAELQQAYGLPPLVRMTRPVA